MSKSIFTGLGVALVTPFDAKGKIDGDALERFINFQIDNKVDFLVALGTTSEAATLTHKERNAVLDSIIEINQGRLPLVVGCGGNNTMEVAELAAEFSKKQHIDGLLSVAPYYNKPGQEGIYQHFSHVAKASTLPVILYNVPSRTASFIEAKTALRLANEFSNVVALKEASGNFDHIMHVLQNAPEHFVILSGDDATTLPAISLGMKGVISVLGNAYPAEFGKLVHAAMDNNYELARKYQYELLPIMDTLFVEGNPAGIKAHLKYLGLMADTLRLPLTPVSQSLDLRIKELALAK